MSISRTYFKFFLVDTPSGLAFYVDAMGNIQKGNILTGVDYSLPQSPGGWDDMQLSFGRSSHYWGLNRTFTIPLKFIGDGAKIVRHLFYAGRGVESQVTLVIVKWDDVTGVFRLYYSGQLDLSKIEDQVAEGVTVNIMQGGIVQMLKAYENTVIEIPCDGSIPENIKVNCDGILLNDVFHYEVVPVTLPTPGDQTLACTFVSNDGDNIGITKNSPMLDPITAGYYQKSDNFIFSSEEPLSVRIKGTLIAKNDPAISNTLFHVFTATSLSQPTGSGGNLLDHANGLVLPYVPPGGVYNSVNNQVNLTTQRSFGFDLTVNLAANEHLFIVVFNNFSATPVTIVGGSFTLTFSSRYRPSRVWGIRPYDLGKLLIQRMNALSSNFLQTFNFVFDSLLLQANPNLIVTSGDALRASTDPNYFQYYNQATLNPINPNNQDFTQYSTLGPVIKTTLADFFDTFNAILNASLSNQQLPGEQESVFIEDKTYVLDPSVITMTLDKISNFRVSLATDYFYNWLKIGYEPQQYDEKAGKYEYNSTVQWQAPIRTISKTLEIISKYRADSYGIEYTRYNTQGGKSSTFNSSDSSRFLLNTDFSSSFLDYYLAKFSSGIPLPTSGTNGDQKMTMSKAFQAVYCDILDGEYFTSQNDFSIFMFNQPTPGLQNIQVNFDALINGRIGDSATAKMWVNGVVLTSWTQAVTGVNTIFNGAFSSSRVFLKGDVIYFTVDTIKTCTVDISDFQIIIGSGAYWSAESSGPINIPAGSTQQLISMPAITSILVGGLEVISYSYQYFRFLSNVQDTNFDWALAIAAYHQGGSGETITFDIWRNGVNIGRLTIHGNSNILTWFNQPISGIVTPILIGNISFALYDIVWLTVSNSNINVWVTNINLSFTSRTIKVYPLLRKPYQNVSGLPNPETAFNLDVLTPKQMLLKNGNILSPAVFNLAPGALLFQTADKNQFVSTTLNGVTIQENASVDIHDLPAPAYYPLVFEIDTEVPMNFADIFNNAANGHIKFIYNNKEFYGFPIQVTAKPALNESQTWKLLCSPKTNLSDLVDLDWDGLSILMPLDISIPIICPVHVVPLNLIKPDVYKNASMDEDWFKNRIHAWIDKKNYAMPRQNDEPLQIQLQTNGLAPVSIQLLDFRGIPVGSPTSIPQISDPAVNAPQLLYQGDVPLNTLADGIYYTLWTVGIGEAQAMFISEPIHVKQDWDYNTIRLDYKNTRNKLATIFTASYAPSIRVHGQINRFTPKSKFTTFIDQPQDIDLLNSIPYDTWKLEIGRGSGIPDYLMRKVARIFDLDTVFIDGNQYTRDADAQWEKQNFPGQAKEFMSLDIRRAKNIDAITMNTSGQLTSDMPGGYTLDPAAFGQSLAGQDLIEVGS
jgi:hypothetical protein